MARTALNVQAVGSAGMAPAYAAGDAANGHEFTYGDHNVLHVKNTDAAAVNVTVVTPLEVQGLALPDRVVSVPAGGERFIGMAPAYRQADGKVHVDLASAVGVTVAVLGA